MEDSQIFEIINRETNNQRLEDSFCSSFEKIARIILLFLSTEWVKEMVITLPTKRTNWVGDKVQDLFAR